MWARIFVAYPLGSCGPMTASLLALFNGQGKCIAVIYYSRRTDSAEFNFSADNANEMDNSFYVHLHPLLPTATSCLDVCSVPCC